MDQKFINLYDEYTHKPLTRQEFMKRLAQLAGGAAAAAALLPLLEVNDAMAQTIAPDDGRLVTENIKYKGAEEMSAYLARPRGNEKRPAVVVIHENRGLNDHIRDVARRAAVAGFLAIAPDALSPQGGAPEDPDQARDMFQNLDNDKTVRNFVAGVAYAKSHPLSTGKVGCVGFCWGGGMSNQMAVHSDAIAVAPFYGRQADIADVPRIKAAMMLHYAGTDERINAGIPAYEEALKKAGINYKIYMYEGAQHAFHNDTAPTRYDEKAARLAWERTIAFFNEKLKG